MGLFKNSVDNDKKFVIFWTINGDKSALVFDSYKNAIDYINLIIQENDESVNYAGQIGDGKYMIEFFGGLQIFADIMAVPKEIVKYHLIKSENGMFVETRRFTNLLNVFRFVEKQIRQYRKLFFVMSIGLGEWKAKKKGKEIRYYLSVALVERYLEERGERDEISKTEQLPDEYYQLLEVDRGANEDEIKKAYRRKSKKMHPDFGGSAEEFKRLNEAYRKLIEEVRNGNHKVFDGGGSRKIQVEVESVETYPCIDILTLLRKSKRTVWNFLRSLVE